MTIRLRACLAFAWLAAAAAVHAQQPTSSGTPLSGGQLLDVLGATFFYAEAEHEIVERTRRIEAVCARHHIAIAAAALQFPLAHPAVASVVTGMRNIDEAAANLGHCQAAIPSDFWDELKRERLIAADAPVPSMP